MRTRLFLVSLALLVVGLAAAELWIVPRLERAEAERNEDLLGRMARAASDALETAGPDGDAQAIARRLSENLGARITYLAADGAVLGDGAVADGEISHLENHRERPEVKAALAGRVGTSSRLSATTSDPYFYLALPADRGARGVITRVAIPLALLHARSAELRRSLVLAALAGLLVAGSLSTLAARLVASPLREMTEVARAIADGRFSGRVDASGSDDLGKLGAALNEMSRSLSHTLAALTSERDLLGAVLDGMSEGVLVTDRDERVVRVNRALAAHLGITIAAGPMPLLEATRRPEIVDHVRAVRASGRPARRELNLGGAAERSFLVSSSPIAGDSVVTVLLEVTERRRLERVRQDFVANVSHELRTPVATLQAAGETLLDSNLDPGRARELTAMVARNAERLGNLVTDLLALARLDAGELDLALVHLEVRPVAARVVDARAAAAAAKRLRVEFDIASGVEVTADERALEQALANLIDNAIRYTPEGGRIGIAIEDTSTSRRLVVWDTGPGIESRHRERIFERFYRVDPGRSRELGGTGLGLAIVRHLVEAMGGKVSVDARPGGGSKFWIELPAGGRDLRP